MDRIERINMISQEFESKINHIINEYDVTCAEMIGVLELCKLGLWYKAVEEEEGEASGPLIRSRSCNSAWTTFMRLAKLWY